MPTDWNALAKLGAAAFKKDTATVVPVRRKTPPMPVAVPEVVPTLRNIPVMFPHDVLCPEWQELATWARQAPTEAFVILPCRAPHKNAKHLTYVSQRSLQLAILDELLEAGGGVVVGLIYELRTMKARWESRRCA